MKTKPQWTKATCLLLQVVDKLHLKPYKWLIGRCGRNLFLIRLSLYRGKCKQEKNGVKNTKTVAAHTCGTLVRYLLKQSNILNLTIIHYIKEDRFAIDEVV